MDNDPPREEGTTATPVWELIAPSGHELRVYDPRTSNAANGAARRCRATTMMGLPRAIYVATEPVNLHLSFDRLAGIVRQQLGADPRSEALFVFHNRRGTNVTAGRSS